MKIPLAETDAPAPVLRKPQWLPISEAPTDGTVVLVWHEHDSDPYFEEDEECLTPYGAWIEGGEKSDDGPYLAFFGGGFSYDESGEGYGPVTTLPDWWLKSDPSLDPPQALAPTHFQYVNTGKP